MDTEAIRTTAANLLSEHGENPEYDRAIAELVCDLTGRTMDEKHDVLTELRRILHSHQGEERKTTEHTPGPWECERDWVQPRKQEGAVFNIRASARGEYQTREFIATVGTMGRTHDDLEANARLIAAAPDLLAAARVMLEATEQGTGFGPGQKLIRDAIAKAEGRA